MASKKPSLYLIDGNSYIYRAFYAIRGLTTSKGFPTNAAYGFTNMLMKVVNEKMPEYLAVCFDPKGVTTRHQVYEEYKATRAPMPEGLVPQIPYIHKTVDAFNIPVIMFDGIEADDVIAAVTRKAVKEGLSVTIVTADKDLFQLINDDVRIYDTMKDEMYGVDECIKKFGVPPEKIPEILGLIGDSSDNIPGVPGVGQKTAVQLITEFGSINNVLENLDKITKPKLKESLKENAETARLSRDLVELMQELPHPVDIEYLKRRPQKSRELIELFKELEFTALLKFVTAKEAPEAEYITVRDEKSLRAIVEEIKKIGSVSVDAETTSTLPMEGEPVGIALCMSDERSYYVPFGHVEQRQGELLVTEALGQLPKSKVIEILKPLLEDPGVKKVGHNIKYDIIALSNMGVELKGAEFDTMVGSYLLNPGRAAHNPESVALEHLSLRKMALSEAVGTGQKVIPYSHVDVETATRYSGEYAYLSWRLAKVLKPKLEAEGLTKLYYEMELPLIYVLAEMERNGIYIDMAYLHEMGAQLNAELTRLIGKIYSIAGEEFNINSPKQLAGVLFEKLNLPPVKKTKSGYSTDEEVLRTLAQSHPLPAEILEYRELFKLKSTYVDALGRLANPRTGRVHTSFNQAVTATGRLSSSDPNLQNIPIRGEIGRKIRAAFSAPRGSVIISADYSQVELRIMAHLANDSSLIESFIKGEDVHRRTASEIFNIAQESVTPELRRRAKAVNFGIMYGLSAYGLSTQLGVHPREAKEYIDAYFNRHYGVKEFIEKTLEETAKTGYAMTLFGRKRPIPELQSGNKTTRSLGERLAVNTPIQGSAADLIKTAMINISRRLKEEGFKAKMVLQVHDELVFEAPEDEARRVKELAVKEMEGAAHFKAPLKVDVGQGPNWGEAH
jgi:DNA polymerase-1